MTREEREQQLMDAFRRREYDQILKIYLLLLQRFPNSGEDLVVQHMIPQILDAEFPPESK